MKHKTNFRWIISITIISIVTSMAFSLVSSEILDGAGYMIAFLSDNYYRSINCRDELAFARDLGKPLLLIYLRENALPPGMQLRLNRIQAIHWYSYKDPEEFYEKAASAAGIDRYR